MRVWKIARACGVVGSMTLTGTYVPSTAEWVRNQVAVYEATDGEQAGTLRDLRKNPVMRVERDGSYLAVASKGGAPEDPEWAHNFRAHPEVELQDKAEKHTYRVRELDGPEYDDWWDHAVATWPTYADYKQKTDRKIPLFLLERA